MNRFDTLYRFDANGNIDYTDDSTSGEVFQTNFDYVDREGAGGHHHHGSHHHGNHDSHHGHHNNHHGNDHHGHHKNHGHHNNKAESLRTGRADECYCVPVAQCPRQSVMSSSGFQDYSALVDPRNLPSEIDSILNLNNNADTDTLDLTVETPLPEDTRSRSLKTTIQAIETNEESKKAPAGNGNDAIDLTDFNEKEGETEKTERRRRRRDAPETHTEEQFPDVQPVSIIIFKSVSISSILLLWWLLGKYLHISTYASLRTLKQLKLPPILPVEMKM